MFKNHFPNRMFTIYFLFYASQAIYNTYLNLYLTDIGISQSQIGMIVSVSTLCLLLTQTFWGNISDRSKNKNTILLILLFGCIFSVNLFYLSKAFWFLMFVISLFTSFYIPAVPISDNITLELLEKSHWDFGHVRMGGTIGYAVTVLIIGFVLNGRYGSIFWMSATLLTACFLLAVRLPSVKGYRTEIQKTPYKDILKNKSMTALIALSLAFSLGQNFYNNFYSIYFRSIGGTSAQIGAMMFVSAFAEIPCLLFMNRLIKRFGVQRIMICAGLMTGLRWFLLSFLSQPVMIIIANSLHGFGFTAFSYGIITYISEHVPKDLRASSQSFNSLIGNIFSRMIFGYIGGVASELFGTNHIMLISCMVMVAATAVFALWSGKNNLKNNPDHLSPKSSSMR